MFHCQLTSFIYVNMRTLTFTKDTRKSKNMVYYTTLPSDSRIQAQYSASLRMRLQRVEVEIF